MRKKRNITHWLSRFRHSRGFGVHSPFAFSFITQTLRDKSSTYYLYPAIEYNGGRDKSELKLLLRVLCRLHPASVDILSIAQYKIIADIVKEVDPATLINKVENPEFMIVENTNDIDCESLTRCLESGGNVFFFNVDEKILDVSNRMTHGMTFSNGKVMIAVGRPDLPRQHFEINFK